MRILSGNVDHVLVVFLADVFDKIGIGLERGMSVQLERSGVSPRIVDGCFPLQVPQVGAAIPFGGVQFFGMGMAREVEPEFIIEPDRINHQGVTLVLTDRFAIPGGIWVGGVFASVHENLPITMDVPLK